MIEKGGDLGDPDQGKRASKRDKVWKEKKESSSK